MCMTCLAFVSAAEFRPAAARACSSTLPRGPVVGQLGRGEGGGQGEALGRDPAQGAARGMSLNCAVGPHRRARQLFPSVSLQPRSGSRRTQRIATHVLPRKQRAHSPRTLRHAHSGPFASTQRANERCGCMYLCIVVPRFRPSSEIQMGEVMLLFFIFP